MSSYEMQYSGRGAEDRGEQRRGLRKKALMWHLGTRLECRHGVFVKTVVRTEKPCGDKSIVTQPDSNLPP